MPVSREYCFSTSRALGPNSTNASTMPLSDIHRVTFCVLPLRKTGARGNERVSEFVPSFVCKGCLSLCCEQQSQMVLRKKERKAPRSHAAGRSVWNPRHMILATAPPPIRRDTKPPSPRKNVDKCTPTPTPTYAQAHTHTPTHTQKHTQATHTFLRACAECRPKSPMR